jgi:hypothetical protein
MLPKRNLTPLLHRTMEWHGFEVEVQPATYQDGPAWLKRLRDRQLAMPLGLDLQEPDWIGLPGLERLSDAPALGDQLWLLLPEGPVHQSDWTREGIEQLRGRLDGICESALGVLQEEPSSRL